MTNAQDTSPAATEAPAVEDSSLKEQFLNLHDEQIEDAHAHGRNGLINVCVELASDFNKSSVIRASNAFLCDETILIGEMPERWAGEPLPFVKVFEDFTTTVSYLRGRGYKIWAVDNQLEFNPQVVYDANLVEKSAFVYGREQDGLYPHEIAQCDGMIFLPTQGPARSLNVAQAASTMIFEYVRQNGI